MILKVLGSSSTGNGYILENDTEALIIEAGMRLITVKKALNFNISKVVGCLVTHQHGDHAKYLKEYLKTGITVLSSREVFASLNDLVYSCWAKTVLPGKGYKIGNFKIIPFEAHHDVPCLGFLISHPETGSILFLTDSFMSDYTFSNLSHIMIECNYADDILDRNIQSGSVFPGMRPRLMSTHMELETCKGVIKANDLSKVINIVLVHLSSQNSDEARFVTEIQRVSGKPVYAARKGMNLVFNYTPY